MYDFVPSSSYRTAIFSEPERDVSIKNVHITTCKPAPGFSPETDQYFEIPLKAGGTMSMMVLAKSKLHVIFHIEDEIGSKTKPMKINDKGEIIEQGSSVACIPNIIFSLFEEYDLILENEIICTNRSNAIAYRNYIRDLFQLKYDVSSIETQMFALDRPGSSANDADCFNTSNQVSSLSIYFKYITKTHHLASQWSYQIIF